LAQLDQAIGSGASLAARSVTLLGLLIVFAVRMPAWGGGGWQCARSAQSLQWSACFFWEVLFNPYSHKSYDGASLIFIYGETHVHSSAI
jgi:hypothetical protein